jgi:hypothetical protein
MFQATCLNTNYEHEILQPHRVHELIERVKGIHRNGYRLLVSTSYDERRIPDDTVIAVADFLLMHGILLPEPHRLGERVEQTRVQPSYTSKPIVFNEDDHYDFDHSYNHFAVALSHYASWGYFDPGQGAGGTWPLETTEMVINSCQSIGASTRLVNGLSLTT